MVKKITISVPDELHERMMKWKEKFNFSKVFQEAITQKIQLKEQFLNKAKGGMDMEAIVERLKQEKIDTEGDWFQKGKEHGFDWAKQTHYEDLQRALEMELDDNGFPAGGDLRDYFHEFFLDEEIEWDGRLMGECLHHHFWRPNEYGDKFIGGFQEGVREFWDQVKDKI